jgi:hypothetical protein
MIPKNPKAMPPGSPIATVPQPRCEPDTASVYPIMYEFVDPSGPLAKGTLDDMEVIWNQSWSHGGYARYNTTSEPDPPAPWPFASLFVARAAVEAGDSSKAWRVLRWLMEIHGGKSGGWFERYGPSITPPAPPVSLTSWTYAEVVLLVVHHLMGFRPGPERLIIRPKLIDGVNELKGRFAVRNGEYELTVRRTGAGPSANVNGQAVSLDDGRLLLNYPKQKETIVVEFSV